MKKSGEKRKKNRVRETETGRDGSRIEKRKETRIGRETVKGKAE